MFWLCILVTFYKAMTVCIAAPLLQPIFITNPWPSPLSSYQQPYIMGPSMPMPAISQVLFPEIPSMSIPGKSSMPISSISPMPMPAILQMLFPGIPSMSIPGKSSMQISAISSMPMPAISQMLFPGIPSMSIPGISPMPIPDISSMLSPGTSPVPISGISPMPLSSVPLSMKPNLEAIPNLINKYSIIENTPELKPTTKTDTQNDDEKTPQQQMQLPDLQSLAALRQIQNNVLAEAYMSQRWSVGDFINGISWLPIEVNVPDAVMGIYNGISSVIGSWAQRIPFINRIITGVAPRPFKILTVGPDGKPYMVPFNMMPMSYGGMDGYPPYNNNIMQHISQV